MGNLHLEKKITYIKFTHDKQDAGHSLQKPILNKALIE